MAQTEQVKMSDCFYAFALENIIIIKNPFANILLIVANGINFLIIALF